MTDTALLTFSVGPVHTFIAQARRVSDLWTGSELLSHLTRQAIAVIHATDGCSMLYPYLEPGAEPVGAPNRFLCRIPRAEADSLARRMEEEVRKEWRRLVTRCVEHFAGAPYELTPDPTIWTAGSTDTQADHVLSTAWSWVPEEGGYAASVRRAAALYDSIRLYRPFQAREEAGEKCAVCGERNALPNGDRGDVGTFWRRVSAEEEGAPEDEQHYLRLDQTRLCLVCLTKRFFPHLERPGVKFSAFDEFAPVAERPYHALIAMDGDRLGKVLLEAADRLPEGEAEGFHRRVSEALSRLAHDLREPSEQFPGGRSYQLSTKVLGTDFLDNRNRGRTIGSKTPQLIYAGGEDVLLVCDPRDALAVARRLNERYRQAFEPLEKELNPNGAAPRLTASAAILFAHTHQPAGLQFRDLERLLKHKAKEETGRNALALRLAKRGGPPVETAFSWDDIVSGPAGEAATTWPEAFDELALLSGERSLSASRIYNLRDEARVLRGVFTDLEEWRTWLRNRLGRTGAPTDTVERLTDLMAPFCHDDRLGSLRIARFLGQEVGK